MNSNLKPLTKRQQQIYDYIVQCLTDFNAPPTRAEIAQQFGFKSPNAAEDHLRALAKKDYIELKSGTSRGIFVKHVTNENEANSALTSSEANSLPIIGDVAAGQPILAQENIQESIQVEPWLFSDHADFLLRVKGDSMINVGIHEKDLLAIKNTSEAKDKQIVVARIGNDVTVKTYQRDGQHVTLLAENDDYQPIDVDLAQEDFAIEGVVVGLIRQDF